MEDFNPFYIAPLPIQGKNGEIYEFQSTNAPASVFKPNASGVFMYVQKLNNETNYLFCGESNNLTEYFNNEEVTEKLKTIMEKIEGIRFFFLLNNSEDKRKEIVEYITTHLPFLPLDETT